MSVNARLVTVYVILTAISIMAVVGFAFGMAGFFKASDPTVAHKRDVQAGVRVALGETAIRTAMRAVNTAATQGGVTVESVRVVKVTRKSPDEADVYMAVQTAEVGKVNLVAHESRGVWNVNGIQQETKP